MNKIGPHVPVQPKLADTIKSVALGSEDTWSTDDDEPTTSDEVFIADECKEEEEEECECECECEDYEVCECECECEDYEEEDDKDEEEEEEEEEEYERQAKRARFFSL